MSKTLEQVDREIRDSERRRVETSAQLMQRLRALDTTGRDLRGETARLVDALKRPGVRGRWGELQLKRVVELAGMIEHCDFDEQQTLTGTNDDRRMRPDVIVRLPGGKHVVVDAKVPLDAYLQGARSARRSHAPGAARRPRAAGAHAPHAACRRRATSAHVPSSPEFVVMFLPGEMFFSAALEQDPSLIEFGVELQRHSGEPDDADRAAAGGGVRLAAGGDGGERAEDQRARARTSTTRSACSAATSTRSARGSSRSLEAYNQAVGSLEGNVLVKARKFKELQAANGGEEIKALEPIDRVPRMLQARELTDGLPFADPSEAESESDAERV